MCGSQFLSRPRSIVTLPAAQNWPFSRKLHKAIRNIREEVIVHVGRFGVKNALGCRTIPERVCQAKNGFHLGRCVRIAQGVMGLVFWGAFLNWVTKYDCCF